MKNRTEREVQRQSRWQEIVRQQEQSGQSVRVYCRQAGIEESAFYWWRRELARRSRQGDDLRQPRRSLPKGKPERAATRKAPRMITCKGADHLPLHRLEGIFKRQGVRISRQTMDGWWLQTAEFLRPLYTLAIRVSQGLSRVLASGRLQWLRRDLPGIPRSDHRGGLLGPCTAEVP